jgi:RNA polymerase sigma-70 factor, ECF subfamily
VREFKNVSQVMSLNPLSLSLERLRSCGLAEERTQALTEKVSPTDNDLIKSIQRGDHKAFEQLFDRYGAVVRAVVRRIVRNSEDVEDVVQEAFLDVYQKSGTFDPAKGTVQTWISFVARYRSIRHWQRTRRRDWRSADLEQVESKLESGIIPDDHARAVDFARCFDVVLGALTERQKQTMLLYFFDGLSLNEIAVQLEESLPNVRHHLYRGLARLRRELFHNRLLAGYTEYDTCQNNKG